MKAFRKIGPGIKSFLVYLLLGSTLCFTVTGLAQKTKDSTPQIQKNADGTTTTIETYGKGTKATTKDGKGTLVDTVVQAPSAEYGEGGTKVTIDSAKDGHIVEYKDKSGKVRHLEQSKETDKGPETLAIEYGANGKLKFYAEGVGGKVKDKVGIEYDALGRPLREEYVFPASDGGLIRNRVVYEYADDNDKKGTWTTEHFNEITEKWEEGGIITAPQLKEKAAELATKIKKTIESTDHSKIDLVPDIAGDIGPESKEEKPAAKESTTPSTKPEAKPTPPPGSNTIPSSTAPRYEIETLSNAGLYTVSVTTPQGTLRVNLTDDLAAGDTISGTVESEPTGRNETERSQNQSALNGYVVELERQQTNVREKWFTRHIPETIDLADRVIRLLQDGREVARTDVPISEARPTPTSFILPTGGQQGKPIEIKGPFDGVLANTDYVKIGHMIVPALAESPRKRVVRDTSEVIGPTKIECGENNKVTECPFRNLGIKLSAGKLSLLKGETTTLAVVVLGLRDLREDVPLNLVNHSPEVIGLAGGNDQNLIIRSGETSTDGTYSIERTLAGIKAGGFNITASVSWTNVCEQPKILAKVGGAPPGTINLPRETIEGKCNDQAKPLDAKVRLIEEGQSTNRNASRIWQANTWTQCDSTMTANLAPLGLS